MGFVNSLLESNTVPGIRKYSRTNCRVNETVWEVLEKQPGTWYCGKGVYSNLEGRPQKASSRLGSRETKDKGLSYVCGVGKGGEERARRPIGERSILCTKTNSIP